LTAGLQGGATDRIQMDKKIKHLVSSKDLSKKDYDEILRRFNHFVERGISPDLARGKVLATLFLQPSVRTMNMFHEGSGTLFKTSINYPDSSRY
jgi:aspartate carbamoyltransferase catalytic subunit